MSQFPLKPSDFDKSIKINPNFPCPWNGLGNVYSETKDYYKAIEVYKKAIEIDGAKREQAYMNFCSEECLKN